MFALETILYLLIFYVCMEYELVPGMGVEFREVYSLQRKRRFYRDYSERVRDELRENYLRRCRSMNEARSHRVC